MVWSVILTKRAYFNLRKIDKSIAMHFISFFLENAEGKENLNHIIFEQEVSSPNFPTYYIVRNKGFSAGIRLSKASKTLTIIFVTYAKDKNCFARGLYSPMSVETMN